MKLRNKKTGEIVEYISFKAGGSEILFYAYDTAKHYFYKSLAEFNEEWEDYEEPKEFYFIDQFMSVSKGVVDDVEYAGRNSAVNYAKKTSNNLKTAGNYFETREEAEQAVEKLKAWKRLKDAGFKFTDWRRDDVYGVSIQANELHDCGTIGMIDELNLLFGGEDEN